MPNFQNFLFKKFFLFLSIFIFVSKEAKADSKEFPKSSFDEMENYLYQYYRESFSSHDSATKTLNHSDFNANPLIKKVNKYLKNSELHKWNYQQYLKTKKIPLKKEEKKELFLKLYREGKLPANARQYQTFFSGRKEDKQGKVLSLLPYNERLKVGEVFLRKGSNLAHLLRFYLIGDYSLLANLLSDTKISDLRVLRLCAWYKEQKWANVYQEYLSLQRLKNWRQTQKRLSHYRPNLSQSAMRYFYYAALKKGKGREYITKIKRDYLKYPNIYFLQVLTKYYNRYGNLELKNVIKKEFSGRYKYSYPASLYHWNIIHSFF